MIRNRRDFSLRSLFTACSAKDLTVSHRPFKRQWKSSLAVGPARPGGGFKGPHRSTTASAALPHYPCPNAALTFMHFCVFVRTWGSQLEKKREKKGVDELRLIPGSRSNIRRISWVMMTRGWKQQSHRYLLILGHLLPFINFAENTFFFLSQHPLNHMWAVGKLTSESQKLLGFTGDNLRWKVTLTWYYRWLLCNYWIAGGFFKRKTSNDCMLIQ